MNATLTRQLKWMTQIVAWLIFFGTGLVFFLGVYDWQWSVFYTGINVSMLMLLFYANSYLIDQVWEKKKYITYAILFIGLLALAGLGRAVINSHFVPFMSLTPVLNPTGRLLLFTIISTLFILLLSFFYRVLMNRYERERQYLFLINQHQEAQLQLLKNQINPHFLFNTLNNIYSLTVIQSRQAPQMILLLSDLLRYVIYESQQQRVSLETEVEYLTKFIDLFQMRNEMPRNIQLVMEGDIHDWNIEPMIFIPIVENCFKHCDFETNEQAYIYITLKVTKNSLHFSTENTYSEIDTQKDKIGGVGLDNIQKRLAMQYQKAHSLQIHKTNHMFILTLQIETPHGTY